jgi:hypothetical protein
MHARSGARPQPRGDPVNFRKPLRSKIPLTRRDDVCSVLIE